MRIFASMLTLALVASAAPSTLVRAHNHAHDDNVSLITRADGTKASQMLQNSSRLKTNTLPLTQVAVVTCMDPRINMDFLLQQLSLTSTNSYIVRNAGGRAKEAMRSVIMSQEYLGTSEVHVIHHTDCGMAEKSEETIRKRFYKKEDLSRTFMVNEMEFLPIRTQNYTESVLDDTSLVEFHPLIKAGSKVTGWVYNIGGNGNDSVTQVYASS